LVVTCEHKADKGSQAGREDHPAQNSPPFREAMVFRVGCGIDPHLVLSAVDPELPLGHPVGDPPDNGAKVVGAFLVVLSAAHQPPSVRVRNQLPPFPLPIDDCRLVRMHPPPCHPHPHRPRLTLQSLARHHSSFHSCPVRTSSG